MAETITNGQSAALGNSVVLPPVGNCCGFTTSRELLVEYLFHASISCRGQPLASLIICPGCKHKLTLPVDFDGQRAQCPRCGIELATDASSHSTAPVLPAMEVDPASPVVSVPSAHSVQTAFADVDSSPARAPTARGGAWF